MFLDPAGNSEAPQWGQLEKTTTGKALVYAKAAFAISHESLFENHIICLFALAECAFVAVYNQITKSGGP